MAATTQTRPMPLTDAQRAVLTAAAMRPDAALILPARLKGGAAQKLAQALIGKALAREVRAKGELPVWRKDADTGRDFSLVLTKAGRTLGITSAEAAEPAMAATVAVPAAKAAIATDAPAAHDDAIPPAAPSPAAPRAGSKLAAVIALLGRQQGSSVAEVMAATGWLPHTTRAALTSLRKRGYALTRAAGGDGPVYRIGTAPIAAA